MRGFGFVRAQLALAATHEVGVRVSTGDGRSHGDPSLGAGVPTGRQSIGEVGSKVGGVRPDTASGQVASS